MFTHALVVEVGVIVSRLVGRARTDVGQVVTRPAGPRTSEIRIGLVSAEAVASR